MIFFDKLRQATQSMFGSNTIEDALGVQLATSEQMLEAQLEWRKMVQGCADWNDEESPSLQLASSISTEVARSVCVEFSSEIRGGKRGEYLNAQYQRLIDNSRNNIEKLCNGGEIIFKPYVSGKEIYINVVENNMYYPVRYNKQGELTRVIFAERIHKDKKFYVLFEDHNWNDITLEYSMTYKAFVSDNGYKLDKEIKPQEVEEWSLIKDMIFKNIKQPLFIHIRMPLQNIIDLESECGVSIFSKAKELIQLADEQFGRTVWEYQGGELAVNASIDLFRKNKKTGELTLPKGKERLYRAFDVEAESLGLDTFAPQYRDEALWRGLDNILKKIEFTCQLSYGIISNPDSVEKTATEIKTAKQRFFSLVSDLQNTYKNALEKLIISMDILATIYKLVPANDYETSFDFDDSIIVDRAVELEQKIALVGAGVLNGYELRAWYLGISEEEAKKTMPEMEELLKDETNEEDDEGNNKGKDIQKDISVETEENNK